jgi:antitoxin component YwqK of YwqJK toxin-antitoxin module
MRAGELHGDWRWYRKDGSLLRTGTFRAGEKVGTWTTHDRSGEPLR